MNETVGTILAFVVIAAVLLLVGYSSCESNWRDSGMEHEFRIPGGCMVKHNGQWIPAKNYRAL